MAQSSRDGAQYEQEHVHDVYEQIASHFSSTRHKPWPIVERFLKERPDGAIGLDVGCGNGKYLSANSNIFIVGSDRSSNLVSIAKRHQPHSVVVADILRMPHPQLTFDFALSIAVVHHLSTAERRVDAIRSILHTLKPGAPALIYVWALEQENSRRGWGTGDEQDVMVPWVMKQKKHSMKGNEDASQMGGDQTFNRYYHLYRSGELAEEIRLAGGSVLELGYEKDNWYAIAAMKDG